jgi:hypothetical protein
MEKATYWGYLIPPQRIPGNYPDKILWSDTCILFIFPTNSLFFYLLTPLKDGSKS